MPNKSIQQPKSRNTRAGGFKVRTGCSTCKIRRVKCDEQKPFCVQCVSTGRSCDGYPERIEPRQKALQPVALRDLTSSLLTPLNADISGTSLEKDSFHVFRSRTAQELSRVMMIDVWSQVLLQACHVFNAMRHAAIAIGSIVKWHEINCFAATNIDQAVVRRNFATLHYYKAVKCLRSQICARNPPPSQYTLMCCLVFICFEFLSGDDSAARVHLRHGLEIVQKATSHELDPLSNAQSPELWGKISWILSTIDAQFSLWLCLPYSKTLWPTDREEITINPQRSYFFTDVEEATQSLQILWGWKCDIQRQYANDILRGVVTTEMTGQKINILSQLERWLIMLNSSVLRWDRMEESWTSHRLTVLRINHQVISIETSLILERTPELFCHSLEPDFQEILRLCSALLVDSKSRNRLVSGSRVGLSLEFDSIGLFLFTITTGIIRALYYTAVHSTDDGTSRKAIALLDESSWREAAWESKTIARMARKRRFENDPV